jgi:hypothetical protein
MRGLLWKTCTEGDEKGGRARRRQDETRQNRTQAGHAYATKGSDDFGGWGRKEKCGEDRRGQSAKFAAR